MYTADVFLYMYQYVTLILDYFFLSPISCLADLWNKIYDRNMWLVRNVLNFILMDTFGDKCQIEPVTALNKWNKIYETKMWLLGNQKCSKLHLYGCNKCLIEHLNTDWHWYPFICLSWGVSVSFLVDQWNKTYDRNMW